MCRARRAVCARKCGLRLIADLVSLPLAQAAETLAAMDAQPMVIRESLMRRIAEEWLEGQRRAWGLIRNNA